MQVFDICFEEDLQQYRGWNVNSIEQSKDDIVFKSHIKFLTAVGVIKNRSSLSIEDYFSKTKHDPVFEYIGAGALLIWRPNYSVSKKEFPFKKPWTSARFMRVKLTI